MNKTYIFNFVFFFLTIQISYNHCGHFKQISKTNFFKIRRRTTQILYHIFYLLFHVDSPSRQLCYYSHLILHITICITMFFFRMQIILATSTVFFTEPKCKGTTMLNMQFISCHCVYDYRVSHITNRMVNDT